MILVLVEAGRNIRSVVYRGKNQATQRLGFYYIIRLRVICVFCFWEVLIENNGLFHYAYFLSNIIEEWRRGLVLGDFREGSEYKIRQLASIVFQLEPL
jgi:hypothetical protein